MSTSIKLISPTNSEKFIFITYEAGWNNTKVYAEGKIVQSFRDASALKNGVVFNIEQQGEVKLKLNPTTLGLTAFLDGEKLVREKRKKELDKNALGVITVFSIIALANLMHAFIGFSQQDEYRDPDPSLVAVPVCLFILYLACAILYGYRIYFFYFIGTAVYLLTTIEQVLLAIEVDLMAVWLIYILPRFILIALLASYTRRVLILMNASKKADPDEVLDDTFMD